MILDFADVKPTLWNVAIVGTMAILWITFLKYILAKWQVPYLSDLVSSL